MIDFPPPSTFSVSDVQQWTKQPAAIVRKSLPAEGYRGIWFALGFKFEYGDKYSGGLGTYTSNHVPMAVYCPEVKKTFFTYGGTPSADQRQLAIMVSYYDHATGKVPRPVTLYLDPSVDDPHDNASIHIDSKGIIWIFKSGRGTSRPGLIFRSLKPYSLDSFELVSIQEFTYPQIWEKSDGGFFLLFTKYTSQKDRGPARKLFWKTSPDGIHWSTDQMLAGFEGHYQTSGRSGNKIATFFNYHPGSNVDKRTNLYYVQTTDWGKTWTTADGQPLKLPLLQANNAARLVDYQSQGKNMYTCDLNFDKDGDPILLYVTSQGGEPGPKSDPRNWNVMHWKKGEWHTRIVTQSGHNYDMGSLYVEGNLWRIIGPTQPGPQRYGTGGEMALWTSGDEGKTWKLEKALTERSSYNHSYARRPLKATDPFYVFWADGNPFQISESHLFFSDSTGNHVLRLPYTMKGDEEYPEAVTRQP